MSNWVWSWSLKKEEAYAHQECWAMKKVPEEVREISKIWGKTKLCKQLSK
jgi:hypothetical protein